MPQQPADRHEIFPSGKILIDVSSLTCSELPKRTTPDTLAHQGDGEELDRWNSYESAQLLPPNSQARVEKPTLSREIAKQLHTMLLAHLEELEAAWERRN
jgi:hypothetical protein